MKRTCLNILLILLSFSALAQKNVVKVNLSSFAFKNVYLSYERAFAKKLSVNLGLSVMPDRGVPLASSFSDVHNNPSPMKDMKMTGWAITPEFRIYTSPLKGSPHGFYVAPYLRISQINFNLKGYDYHYEDIYNNDKKSIGEVNFTGKASFVGGGIMIGHQWIIGKHVSIDFWIVGVGINKANFTLRAQSDNMDERYFREGSSFSDDISDNLKVLNSVNVESGTDNVKASSDRILPGLRGLGFNLGVAF